MTSPETSLSRERVIGQGLTWLAIWSLKWILIAAGAVLLGLVVRFTWSITLPVFLALVLTSVLQPISALFERRLRFPAGLAAVTTIVGSLALLVAAGFALAPSVRGQSDDIARDTVSGLQRLQDWVQHSEFFTQDQIDSVIQSAQGRLTESASSIASGVIVGVGAVGSAVVTAVLAVVLTFFFLKDGRRFLPWVRSVTGHAAGDHLADVMGRSWATLGGFIRVQALVSFIDAFFIGLGLLIVGVPLAVPLAVLTFLGGFIPIVGAVVVGAIAVLVALVSVGLTGALIVLGIILGVQQLESNVLQPWLQSRTMQLHAAVVLLAVTLGSTLFGIIGAFLAVPVTAVLAVVMRYLSDQVDEARGLSAAEPAAPAPEPPPAEPPAPEPEPAG